MPKLGKIVSMVVGNFDVPAARNVLSQHHLYVLDDKGKVFKNTKYGFIALNNDIITEEEFKQFQEDDRLTRGR